MYAGAAGAERSVLVWEPRKWALLDRWSNCLKYEATGLHFSSGGCWTSALLAVKLQRWLRAGVHGG